MKKILGFLLLSSTILAAPSTNATSRQKLVFSPETGVVATITSEAHEVIITLKINSVITTNKVPVDTEKPLNFLIEDYNFDGRNDFSISHVDDGMGTYIVYDVYIYSQKIRKFIPLRPKCGDQFINLKLSKNNQTITNSYFSNNHFETCTSKY